MRTPRGHYERVLNFDNQSAASSWFSKPRWHRTLLGVTSIQGTRREARRIAVRAALLNADRPDEMVGLVHRIAMLWVEPSDTVAPAEDHPAGPPRIVQTCARPGPLPRGGCAPGPTAPALAADGRQHALRAPSAACGGSAVRHPSSLFATTSVFAHDGGRKKQRWMMPVPGAEGRRWGRATRSRTLRTGIPQAGDISLCIVEPEWQRR